MTKLINMHMDGCPSIDLNHFTYLPLLPKVHSLLEILKSVKFQITKQNEKHELYPSLRKFGAAPFEGKGRERGNSADWITV